VVGGEVKFARTEEMKEEIFSKEDSQKVCDFHIMPSSDI
jgi:hypothetical protein